MPTAKAPLQKFVVEGGRRTASTGWRSGARSRTVLAPYLSNLFSLSEVDAVSQVTSSSLTVSEVNCSSSLYCCTICVTEAELSAMFESPL